MTLELINQFEAHLRERGRTPRTIATYTRTLRVMSQELPYGLDVANETELKAWIWRDGLSEASRAAYFAAAAGFFSWAVEYAQILDFDPTRRMTRPRVGRRLPRVAVDDQVREVLTRAHEPYRLWALLAAYAGLRCIEVHGLRREHVTERRLIVARGKGGGARQLPTHPLIWRAVKDMPAGAIAGAEDEREISRAFFQHCSRKLGISGVSMHRLRGWWATKTYRATKDIRAVQHGLGHASPQMTAGYIDVADTQLQAMIDGLPTFE